MPEPHFTTLDDDLPRTFRRERDAREREAKEREAREREMREPPSVLRATTATSSERPAPDPVATGPRLGEPVTVTRLEIPFAHLVAFFFKAIFAALPALLVLTVILWGIGETLQRTFPWLVKMRILIQFPG